MGRPRKTDVNVQPKGRSKASAALAHPKAKASTSSKGPASNSVIASSSDTQTLVAATGDVEVLKPRELCKPSSKLCITNGEDTPEVTEKIRPDVLRLFRTKLKQYDRTYLCSLTGRTTQLRVVQYLANGIDNLSGTRRHLSSKFWTEFFTEYGLRSPLFSGLDEIAREDPSAQMPSTELIEALLETRCDNPTQRKTAPFSNGCNTILETLRVQI